ncbi:MAG: DUF177 domain-containing protein [Candidatus Omnitrophota bacterium]
MKISVHEIPAQGELHNEIKTGQELELQREDIEFIKPVEIAANVSIEHNNVIIYIKVKSRIRVTCNRCLKETEREIKKEIDMIRPVTEGAVIDLTQIVRDEIILDYPVKVLCSPDCKGLCAQCGRNLNDGNCRCEEEDSSFPGIDIN